MTRDEAMRRLAQAGAAVRNGEAQLRNCEHNAKLHAVRLRGAERAVATATRDLAQARTDLEAAMLAAYAAQGSPGGAYEYKGLRGEQCPSTSLAGRRCISIRGHLETLHHDDYVSWDGDARDGDASAAAVGRDANGSEVGP